MIEFGVVLNRHMARLLKLELEGKKSILAGKEYTYADISFIASLVAEWDFTDAAGKILNHKKKNIGLDMTPGQSITLKDAFLAYSQIPNPSA